MNGLVRWLFFSIVVRPIVMIILGLNVRGREHLPLQGPAVLAANHNSHLDTMVLISLIPLGMLHRVRPVAAMDYFMRNRFMAWFSTRIVGILPIARDRGDSGDDPLAECGRALDNGEILIFFPEGSRGEPERMARFRGGLARLAARYPQVPVVPVFMYGLGKALPRGEALFVPFLLDVLVGKPLYGKAHPNGFMNALKHRIETLGKGVYFAPWE